MDLKKGTARYNSAVALFGQQFVDKLLEETETKSQELIDAGIEFKTFGNKFFRFWNSARVPAASKSTASAAAAYFGR